MWILTNSQTDECLYIIKEQRKVSIGRCNADLNLSNDSSISRTHAFLHCEESVVGGLVVELEDAGSKYGTYYNAGIESKTPVPKNERITLRDGDRIRFGVLENLWHVHHNVLHSLVSSTLSAQQMEELERILDKLGGKVVQECESTFTYHTMDNVTLTLKVLHALVEQAPIVTLDYWKMMLKAVREKRRELPVPELYIPSCSQAFMQAKEVDFGRRAKRAKVFDGITVIFLSQVHNDMYAKLVLKAGGNCKNLNTGVQKTFLLRDNVLVIQYMPQTQSQSVDTIHRIEKYLAANGRRMIPEYEIGLAIVHCSVDTYCNPKYKMPDYIMPSTLSLESGSERSGGALVVDEKLTDELTVPETNEQASHNMQEEQMPNIRVTESENSGATKPQEVGAKRKRVAVELETRTVEDSDEEILPCSAKRLQLSLSRQGLSESQTNTRVTRRQTRMAAEKCNSSLSEASTTTPKARYKPLPIGIVSTRKRTATATSTSTTTNTMGFLQKQPNTNKETGSDDETAKQAQVETTKTTTAARKRRQIQVISDNDDIDGNLLRFCDSRSGKRARARLPAAKKARPAAINSSYENLFEFGASEKQMNDIQDEEDAMLTEPFVAQAAPTTTVKQSAIKMPVPKTLPRTITVDSWLSCSLSNIKIKVEKAEVVADANAVGVDEVDNKATVKVEEQWLNELKGGFEVRKKPTEAKMRGSAEKSATKLQRNNSSSNNSNSSNTGKNFKTFAKKFKSLQKETTIATAPRVFFNPIHAIS